MNTNENKNLIVKLRVLAGQIGGLKLELPNVSDAENYDFQVQVGLAQSVAEIFDYDISKVIEWFGYCMVPFGLGEDQRVNALLDALDREVEMRLDAADESCNDFDADEPAL